MSQEKNDGYASPEVSAKIGELGSVINATEQAGAEARATLGWIRSARNAKPSELTP